MEYALPIKHAITKLQKISSSMQDSSCVRSAINEAEKCFEIALKNSRILSSAAPDDIEDALRELLLSSIDMEIVRENIIFYTRPHELAKNGNIPPEHIAFIDKRLRDRLEHAITYVQQQLERV